MRLEMEHGPPLPRRKAVRRKRGSGGWQALAVALRKERTTQRREASRTAESEQCSRVRSWCEPGFATPSQAAVQPRGEQRTRAHGSVTLLESMAASGVAASAQVVR